MFLFKRQSALVTKLEPSFQGFCKYLGKIMCIFYHAQCTTMVGYYPPGLCYHNKPFGFGGLSLCKKALQAIGEYIPQEVKNLHVCIHVCYPTWNGKAAVHFCVKTSNALDNREWNVAPFGLDNQCMAQIPLSENTLASQLIINSIFFFFWEECFFHVNWCWGWGRSKPSQRSHCLTLMSMLESQRSPNSHVPTTDVVSALKREK